MPTVKHLSYAGITLPLPNPALERSYLARIQNPYDFTDVDFWNFDTPSVPSIPTPPIPTPPEFKLNVLTWPTGASNPAYFHFVATPPILAAIKLAVGSTATPAPLYFYDGRLGKTVTALMRMLPERPLAVLGNATSDLYLVTLVDERFFWYWRRDVVSAPESWTDLFSQLSVILGTPVTVDTVDPAYLTPSPKWATIYDAPNVLLDAAAAQVGQKVVVALDGSVFTVNWETARTASTVYFAAATTAPVAGGLLVASDIARSVPASVQTVFTVVTPQSTTPCDNVYVVEKTLVELAIAPYGAATGVIGFHDTAFADSVYDGTNAADLDAYAEAISTDLYGWRLSDADVAFAGIEPFTPTGWEDRIEWTLTTRDDGPFSLTRIVRGPWLEFAGGDATAGVWAPVRAPAVDCTNAGSGSGSGPVGFSDDGWPDDCIALGQDGFDPKSVRETLCLGGKLYVTRGRLQIVSVCGRLRNDWYDLSTTQEGCCKCDEGSGSGSGGPCDVQDCCPDGFSTDPLVFVATLPLSGEGCDPVEIAGTSTFNPDTGTWEAPATDSGSGSGPGGLTVSVTSELKCVNGAFVLKLLVTCGCEMLAMTVPLSPGEDCESLEASVPISICGCSGTMTFSIDAPCPVCGGGFDCVDEVCVDGTTYATLGECQAACLPDACCGGSIPSVITATVENVSGCPNADGLVVTMTEIVTGTWAITSATGGGTGCDESAITQFSFFCGTKQLSVTFGADNIGTSTTPTSVDCGPPFVATYLIPLTFTLDETCCSGTIRVTITG